MYFINESDIVIASEGDLLRPACRRRHRLGTGADRQAVSRPPGDVLRCAPVGNDERIRARTAMGLGLVSEVAAREGSLVHAETLAGTIATRRSDAVQGTIKAIWEALDVPAGVANQHGMTYVQLGNGTEPPGTAAGRAPSQTLRLGEQGGGRGAARSGWRRVRRRSACGRRGLRHEQVRGAFESCLARLTTKPKLNGNGATSLDRGDRDDLPEHSRRSPGQTNSRNRTPNRRIQAGSNQSERKEPRSAAEFMPCENTVG